jgi:hypothetical protein
MAEGDLYRVVAPNFVAGVVVKDDKGDLETTEGHSALDALDDQFYALDKSEAVGPLIVRYIRQHPDQIVAD